MRRLLAAVALGLAISLGAQAAPPPSDIEIDRVEILGNTVFTEADIEAALEISPGDKLDRAKVVRTAENLQTLYRIHGYEETSIKSRLSRKRTEEGTIESVLEFDIVEGRPTRITDIRFFAEGFRGASFEKYWRRLSSDLVSRSGLNIGDAFDQEKVAAGKRSLQDLLASEEFIGARVDDVRIVKGLPPDPSHLPKDVKLEGAARWVVVEFHVDLGERVTFGFRGNQVFSVSRLSALIDEQRLLGFGKDYVTSIQERIVDEYKSEGYGHASIEAYSFEEEPGQRHVTYVIDEGPRVRIESVDFDGNSVFGSEELRKQFYERAVPVVQYGYYSEKDVQRAAELLVEWMKSKGYLAAKLVTINTYYPPKPRPQPQGSAVKLVIYLYEGDQTIVQSVTLNGVHALPVEEIKRTLGVQEQEPLNLFAFSEGIEKLKQTYRAQGYLGIVITNEGTDTVVRYSGENRLADIRLDVNEGIQYKVSKVQIEGLVRTHESVVKRELLVRENEILREPDLLGSETRLHRLGIFSTISVRALDDPDRDGYKIVRVSLQEGTPGIVAGGIGLRNDLGIRGFGQFGYSNLWGLNHAATLNLNANHRFEDFRFVEYAAQLAYIYPYFFEDLTTFRPTVTFAGTQYLNFDALSAAVALTWERPLTENKALTGLFTYSLEHDLQFNATNPIDNQGIRIGAISPAIRYDRRDNPLAPTRGLWLSGNFEVADPLLGSQRGVHTVAYIRTQWRTDYFIPIASNISWYLSFRIGYERSYAPVIDENDPNSGALPLIKQFALGGAGSIRGFQEQELNFQNYAIRGALGYSNYRTQLDLPFAGQLRVGPFFDAANLVQDHFHILTQDMNFAAGFGFHYQTPVGPVNLDWGFKLNPQPNTPTHQFYFSIGII